MNEQLELARAEVVRIAAAILSAHIGLVECTRELLPHLLTVLEERDENLRFFIGLDSETDHFPVGLERKHWNREALHVKDQELRAAEAFYRDAAEAALTRIIAQLHM
jgi:hypothetical protein